MLLPACAHDVAHGECVCTIPPKSLNALYNSICVGVSEDGFKSPSTLFPSRSMTTISSGESLSYSTPLGLITNKPLSLSIPLTFPHVYVIRPLLGSSIFAS